MGLKGAWNIPSFGGSNIFRKQEIDSTSSVGQPGILKRRLTASSITQSGNKKLEGTMTSTKLYEILDQIQQIPDYPNLAEITVLRKLKEQLDNTVRMKKKKTIDQEDY